MSTISWSVTADTSITVKRADEVVLLNLTHSLTSDCCAVYLFVSGSVLYWHTLLVCAAINVQWLKHGTTITTTNMVETKSSECLSEYIQRAKYKWQLLSLFPTHDKWEASALGRVHNPTRYQRECQRDPGFSTEAGTVCVCGCSGHCDNQVWGTKLCWQSESDSSTILGRWQDIHDLMTPRKHLQGYCVTC